MTDKEIEQLIERFEEMNRLLESMIERMDKLIEKS